MTTGVAGQRVSLVTGGTGGIGRAVALGLARGDDRVLFVGRDAYRDHGITVIDLETQKEVAEIPLSRAPSSLAWDAEHGRLFASHTYYHQISVLDVEAGTVLAVIPSAVGLVDLDTDPDRGQVFLTDSIHCSLKIVFKAKMSHFKIAREHI